MSISGLVPIINFARLSDTLYRGGQPQYRYQYMWLRDQVGVNRFVNLRAESRLDDAMIPRALGTPTESLLIPVRDDHAPTLAQARQFLDFIEASEEPTFFHCAHGHGRTSTFAAIARLSQGWTLEKALEEEAALGYTFPHKEQLDFLTSFAADFRPKVLA